MLRLLLMTFYGASLCFYHAHRSRTMSILAITVHRTKIWIFTVEIITLKLILFKSDEKMTKTYGVYIDLLIEFRKVRNMPA